MARKFEDAPAGANMALPFSYAVTGYAGAGKTFSALLLAKGVAAAKGCEVWCIDTDNRSQEYADVVPHRRVQMDPPYSPGDFAGAIAHCVRKGAGVIVVDCMSDEHDGEGGLLDMRARDPSKSVNAWTPVKDERKKMERYMRALRDREDVVFGLTYRADLKYKPKSPDQKLREQTEGREKDPTDKEWSISTTSDLAFMCSLRFLLPPGSEGQPLLKPTTTQEKILLKTTLRYQRFLESVGKLTPEVGQRLYELARGLKPGQQQGRGKPLSFNERYEAARGPVAESDPPELEQYLLWLQEQPQSPNRDRHMAAVQTVYNTMLNAGEAAQ